MFQCFSNIYNRQKFTKCQRTSVSVLFILVPVTNMMMFLRFIYDQRLSFLVRFPIGTAPQTPQEVRVQLVLYRIVSKEVFEAEENHLVRGDIDRICVFIEDRTWNQRHCYVAKKSCLIIIFTAHNINTDTVSIMPSFLSMKFHSLPIFISDLCQINTMTELSIPLPNAVYYTCSEELAIKLCWL